MTGGRVVTMHRLPYKWWCILLTVAVCCITHVNAQCSNPQTLANSAVTTTLRIGTNPSGAAPYYSNYTLTEGTAVQLYYQLSVSSVTYGFPVYSCPPAGWNATVNISLSAITPYITGRSGAPLTLLNNASAVSQYVIMYFNSSTYNVPQTIALSSTHDYQYTNTRQLNITNTLTAGNATGPITTTPSLPTAVSDVDADALHVMPFDVTQTVPCQVSTTSSGQLASLILQSSCTAYTFTVALASQPYAPVMWTFTNNTNYGYNTTSLVFTASNWNVTRVLAIGMTSVGVINGTQNVNLRQSMAIQSSDPYYNSTLLSFFTTSQIIQNTFSYSSISPNFAAIFCPAPVCAIASACVFPNKTINTMVTVTLAAGQTFDGSQINGVTTLPTVQCMFFDQSVAMAVSGVTAADATGVNQVVTGTIIGPDQVQCPVPTCARNQAKISQGDPQNCVSFDYSYKTTSLSGAPLTLIVNGQLSVNNQQFTYNMNAANEYPAITGIAPSQIDINSVSYITITGVFFDYNFESGMTPVLACMVDGRQSSDVWAINPSGSTTPIQTPDTSSNAIVCRVDPRPDLQGTTNAIGVQVNIAFNGQDFSASNVALRGAFVNLIDLQAQQQSTYSILFYLSFNIVILIFIGLFLQRWLCPMLCRKRMYIPEERKVRAVTGPQLLIEMLEPIVAKAEEQQRAEQAKIDAENNAQTKEQAEAAKQQEIEEKRAADERARVEREQRKQLKANARAMQLELKAKEKAEKQRAKRETRLRMLENPDFMTGDDAIRGEGVTDDGDIFGSVQPTQHDTALAVNEQYDQQRAHSRQRQPSVDQPVDDTGKRLSVIQHVTEPQSPAAGDGKKASSRKHKSTSHKAKSKKNATPSKPNLVAAAAADAGVAVPATDAKAKKSSSKKHKKASHKKSAKNKAE